MLSVAVGIVIGGVSEVAVSVEIKITIKLKKNLLAVKTTHLGVIWATGMQMYEVGGGWHRQWQWALSLVVFLRW